LPDFELRGDGTVVVTMGDDIGPFGDTYRLTEAGIDRVRDLFADVETDEDAYGDVHITDVPSTGVSLNFDGAPVSFGVYALNETDGTGLSDDEAAARRHLVEVLGQLQELPADEDLLAGAPAPFTPDTLDVMLEPWLSDGSDLQAISLDLATPLLEHALGYQDISGRPCVTVGGADAVELAKVVDRTGPQDQPWSTGAATGTGQPTAVIVDVSAVPRDDQGCAERAGANPPLPIELHLREPGTVTLVDPSAWEGALPAERFTPANGLLVYALLPEFVDDVQALTESDQMADYEYQAVVAEANGRRYLDVEGAAWWASESRSEFPNPPDTPRRLRIRVDIETAKVTTFESTD
jgi:hypothetical protein